MIAKMAYDKEKIHEECIRVIREEKVTFFNDLAIYIEPTMSTLYEWEFEKSEDIKRELAKNKLRAKKKMRMKWEESENATLQIAAYKLIAEKEEIEALTVNKVDNRNTYPEGVRIIIEEVPDGGPQS
jgi:23S rRNA G2069 N7-methylase RlmK/C1962 C5-methylase RlmI